VSSAGIGLGGTVLDQSREDWDEVMRINLTGVYLTCRAALPELLKTRGSIITIASTNSLRATPGSAAYCTSKAAVLMLTQCIAADFARDGIRANAILPGWIRTPMADVDMDSMGGPLGTDREGVYKLLADLTPQRRIGLPEDIADVVAWLAGPGAGYVNGAAVPVDGASMVLDPSTVSIIP
jgi:NAD(P)-dependent dehydrogenase (short-subunit alcohol dehydrogenase family)